MQLIQAFGMMLVHYSGAYFGLWFIQEKYFVNYFEKE
jgi:hypothetical protein